MTDLSPRESIMESHRFTLFPKLPMEMKDKIWRLALEPRLVEVRPKEDIDDGFYSTAPLPALLTVCKEWERALKHLYPKYFVRSPDGPGIRFNAQIDTLYLDWKLQEHLTIFLSSISVEEAGKIQFLAMDQHIRWLRQPIDLDHDWESIPPDPYLVTIANLLNEDFRRHCHLIVHHDHCMIGSEDLEGLCSLVRHMKKLKELIFVHEDIAWDVDLLRVSGVFPQQDELATLTLFKLEEVYDLFPNPVNITVPDYRKSIEYYNDDLPICNLQVDLKSKFDSPKFEILVRYGWRFPDSLSLPSRQPRLTELE
ncbi:uncharacterized protein EAE98_012145 [Botrytis deweyae]|uniref:2EXR domain-containing protein n=1 Tax=Botrytis deweyae TaxID=2478750 RepID=A0ABQ7I3W8_9HELO|nr:uncharacterized protein EAE98_012145 [Botrytis deweyae]KAF7910329.1 hypothetical protein EAE98_012145 [Botrytis deweyae]